MRQALAFGVAEPGHKFGSPLAGFLLRGGIVLLFVPISVLPSVLGIAGATGVDAFGIDGRPTPWLFESSRSLRRCRPCGAARSLLVGR